MLRRSKQIKKAIAGTDFSGSLSSKLSSSFYPCADETPPTLPTPTTDWSEYLNENIYVTPDGKLNIKFLNAPRSQPNKKFVVKYEGVENLAGLTTTVYYFPRDKTINNVKYNPSNIGFRCFWNGPYIDNELVYIATGTPSGNKTEQDALLHIVDPYQSYVPTDPYRKYSLYIVVGFDYRAEYFAIYIP